MPDWSAWPFPSDDPYPDYRAARECGPILRPAGLGAHVVLSYDLARSTLKASGWSSDPRNSPDLLQALGGPGPGADLFTRSLLTSDAPAHTRLRQAVNRFFTPKAMRRFQHRAAAIVETALEPVADGEPLELMEDLARPIPLAVMAELFDVGLEGAQVLRDHTPDLVGLLELDPTPELLQRVSTAAMSIMLFLVPIVAERRHAPGDDLISALLHPPSGEPLEADEVINMCLILLAAGHVTTAGLIGNGTLALLEHPEQLRWLAERPQAAGRAVEELLRYDSPVHIGMRIARDDTDLAGTPIARGDQVLIVLGAANRDPALAADPETLRLDREDVPHLAFGHGAHFCLGAGLARLEATEVFARLAEPLTRVAPDTWSYTRRPSRTLREIADLHLAADGRPVHA